MSDEDSGDSDVDTSGSDSSLSDDYSDMGEGDAADFASGIDSDD